MPTYTTADAPGTGSSLRGLSVVVTRPAGQAEGLCRMLEAEGAQPVRFPTLAIVEPRDESRARAVLGRVEAFDMAVFVSVNAVRWWLRLVDARHRMPPGVAVAAVGKATALALARRAVAVSVQPRAPFDSASLLALPELQAGAVAGRRVLIVRGEGGRELLADTLRARGAAVEYAEVYRRVRPAADSGPLQALQAAGADAAIVITSGEGLRNLFAMVCPRCRPWLRATPFVVPSRRLARRVSGLGVAPPPMVAAQATDAALVAALKRGRGA